MTLEEAAQSFEDIVEALSDPTRIAGQMSQELDNLAYTMRRLAPEDSGRLRSSISLLGDSTGKDLSVVLSMLEYGYYQNFGVKPSASTPFNTLDGTTAPRRQPYGVEALEFTPFSYSNRRYGLPATVFFDYDELRDQVAFITENNIFEATNEKLD